MLHLLIIVYDRINKYVPLQSSVPVGGDKPEQALQERVSETLAAGLEFACKHHIRKYLIFVGRASDVLVISAYILYSSERNIPK